MEPIVANLEVMTYLPLSKGMGDIMGLLLWDVQPSWKQYRTGCFWLPVLTPDAFACWWCTCGVTWDAVPVFPNSST